MRILIAWLLFGCVGWCAEYTNLYTPLVLTNTDGLYILKAAASPSWSPTNIATLSAWWDVANAITNESGCVTNINDSWTNQYRLTCLPAGPTLAPVLSNNWLNGKPAAWFIDVSPEDKLTSATFTNYGEMEIWMLAKYGSVPTDKMYIECGVGIPASVSTRFHSSGNIGMFGNGFVGGNAFAVGIPMVCAMIHGISEGGVMTNNVRNFTAQTITSTQPYPGIQFNNNDYTPIKWGVAEICTFSATNTAANRSNLFWYFTNKYGALP